MLIFNSHDCNMARSGEIRRFPPFLTLKKSYLPLSRLQFKPGCLNLVCRCSRNSQWSFWGLRLFSFIAPLQSPKNSILWLGFLIASLPPSRKIKIIYSTRYRQKSLWFGQSDRFGDCLNIYECGRVRVKIQWCPNFGEEVLRGQKCKNFSFLSPSILNSKLCNKSKNRSPRSFRRKDKGFFFIFFDFEKGLCLPYHLNKLN